MQKEDEDIMEKMQKLPSDKIINYLKYLKTSKSKIIYINDPLVLLSLLFIIFLYIYFFNYAFNIIYIYLYIFQGAI